MTSGVSTTSLVAGVATGFASEAASSLGFVAGFEATSSLGAGVSVGFGVVVSAAVAPVSDAAGCSSTVPVLASAFSIAAAISAGSLSRG